MTGSVTLIQRFGGSLAVNPHFHSLFIDGTYELNDQKEPSDFHSCPTPKVRDLEPVLAKIIKRIIKHLQKAKIIVKDENSHFQYQMPDQESFSILQASGVPVMSSLQILSGTIGNTAIAREFDQVRDRVEEGRGISGPLSTARYFTPMVIQMVAIGEESGQLDEMLQAVSVHYDDEVAFAVKRLSDAIGPVLVVGLAFVVGFFALAVFLPMWDLTKIATKGF